MSAIEAWIQDVVRHFSNDGFTEVGISAGVDKALDASKKLHLPSSTVGEEAMITHAVSHLDADKAPNPSHQKMLVAGAVAVIHWKLYDVKRLDSDILLDAATLEGGAETDCASPDVMHALIMIVATKVNMYQINHHTGQGRLSGYARKTAVTMHSGNEGAAESMAAVYHRIGHWASTSVVLRFLLRGYPAVWAHPRISASADMSLRLNGPPAGAGKVGVMYACMQRLLASPVLPLFPDVGALIAVHNAYHRVMEKPLEYHIGAAHLVGTPRNTEFDGLADSFLGRLGAFVSTVYSRSTLARSPSVTRGSEEVFKGYSDYSESFHAMVRNYIEKAGSVSDRVLSDVLARSGITDPESAILVAGRLKDVVARVGDHVADEGEVRFISTGPV